MRFTGCDMPSDERTWDLDWSRPLSNWAGFFGAIPYGLGIWLVLAMLFGAADGQMEVIHYLAVLLCILPLLPFVLAATRIEWEELDRAMGVIGAGLGVGSLSILLFCFAGVVIFPAGALGLSFGLVALLPCWWRGDTAGRAMSLLGPASATTFILFVNFENSFRGIRLDATSPTYPFLTNRQVAYALVMVLIAGYTLVLRWAIFGKPEPFKKGDENQRNPAWFALVGAVFGGFIATFAMGMICAMVNIITHLGIYGCMVSGGIAGAVFGAIASSVAGTTGRLTSVSGKVAMIALCMVVGMAQILFWNCRGDSFTVLVGGLIGLYEGSVVGSKLGSKRRSPSFELE